MEKQKNQGVMPIIKPSAEDLNESNESFNLLTKFNRANQDVNEGRLTPLSEIKKEYCL